MECALKCSGCGARVRLVGFITEPATVRQILEHVGEPTIAPVIAPARSPPLEMECAQRLAAPEAVFEAIPELEFDQTANLTAEAGHDRLLHDAGVDGEPITELEFDQTLGSQSCAVDMALAAERGLVWFRHSRGAASGVVCQIRIAGSVQFPPVTRIKSLRTQNKSGL